MLSYYSYNVPNRKIIYHSQLQVTALSGEQRCDDVAKYKIFEFYKNFSSEQCSVVTMSYANGGDYDEFENGDEKEQKGLQEEQFMLRPNFSDDPEDQWDIVSFFDQNEKFKQFKPILLLQMQIQNAVHNNDDGMGNHNDQLDHLLDSMLNPNDRNDSSSEVLRCPFLQCSHCIPSYLVISLRF